MTIIEVGPQQYRVGTHYVDVSADIPAENVCDCEDYLYRGHRRPCKHLRAVRAYCGTSPVAEILDNVRVLATVN